MSESRQRQQVEQVAAAFIDCGERVGHINLAQVAQIVVTPQGVSVRMANNAKFHVSGSAADIILAAARAYCITSVRELAEQPR